MYSPSLNTVYSNSGDDNAYYSTSPTSSVSEGILSSDSSLRLIDMTVKLNPGLTTRTHIQCIIHATTANFSTFLAAKTQFNKS